MEFSAVLYDLLVRCQRLSLRCHTQCLAAWTSSPFVPSLHPLKGTIMQGVGRADGIMGADPGASLISDCGHLSALVSKVGSRWTSSPNKPAHSATAPPWTSQ